MHRQSGLSQSEQKWRLIDIDVEGRPSVGRLVHACRELIAGQRHILTVWGGYGVGKTLALQAVVNEMNERRVPAVYYTTKQMLDYLRDGMDVGPGERGPRVTARHDRLAELPVLALDEFDKISPTDWVQEQLTYIIDRRHRLSEAGSHATLIAMNADPGSLQPWITSRLMAGCNVVVHVEGGDLRPAITERRS
ncbi:MAG TPA: AAA family ATPase [Anaerolineales bacterium]|nr:AAA family ATPase [Anaerolineales bacterium]